MNDHRNETPDPELAAMARSLDSLAQADRAAAPADLEARIVSQTASLLPAPAPLPFVVPAVRKVGTTHGALRLAAALALAAALGAIWLAKVNAPTTSPSSGTQIASSGAPHTTTDATSPDEEMLFALAGWGTEDTGGLTELRQATDDLGNSLRTSWITDLSGSTGDEGTTQ